MADFGDHLMKLVLIMIIGLIMFDATTNFLIVTMTIMTEVPKVILLMLGLKKIAGHIDISGAWVMELRAEIMFTIHRTTTSRVTKVQLIG